MGGYNGMDGGAALILGIFVIFLILLVLMFFAGSSTNNGSSGDCGQAPCTGQAQIAGGLVATPALPNAAGLSSYVRPQLEPAHVSGSHHHQQAAGGCAQPAQVNVVVAAEVKAEAVSYEGLPFVTVDKKGQPRMQHLSRSHNREAAYRLGVREQRLWEDHYWLTRDVINRAARPGACDADALQLLLSNQDELGANLLYKMLHVIATKKLRGKKLCLALAQAREASCKLTALLREHIQLALAAIQSNGSEASVLALRANADQVAALYACVLGRDLETTRCLFQGHIDHLLEEAVAILHNDCAAATHAGRSGLAHLRRLADFLNGWDVPCPEPKPKPCEEKHEDPCDEKKCDEKKKHKYRNHPSNRRKHHD